jgi:hypothetical protein
LNLFPKLKIKPKGRRFETVSDIQRALDSIKQNDFHGSFEAWKKRWDRCIRSQGDHFESSELYIVAYLLKARTVEPGKQTLLGNARMQQ